MTTHASATFEVKAWDEKPYNESSGGGKLTRASVTKAFQGDFEGESILEYLMVYPENGPVNFVGLERLVGRLGGRSGSFVLQHSGIDDSGTIKATHFVVPGSGTGELSGLRGQGGYVLSGHAQHYPITLDYDFD